MRPNGVQRRRKKKRKGGVEERRRGEKKRNKSKRGNIIFEFKVLLPFQLKITCFTKLNKRGTFYLLMYFLLLKKNIKINFFNYYFIFL